MATVLQSAPKSKAARPVRCRDCGGPIADEATTWSARCEVCDDVREARKALDEIIASNDARLIHESLNWLQLALNDAPIFRSARGRRILDDAVSRAIEVVNVREVRDPVIVGGEEDYDY